MTDDVTDLFPWIEPKVKMAYVEVHLKLLAGVFRLPEDIEIVGVEPSLEPSLRGVAKFYLKGNLPDYCERPEGSLIPRIDGKWHDDSTKEDRVTFLGWEEVK